MSSILNSLLSKVFLNADTVETQNDININQGIRKIDKDNYNCLLSLTPENKLPIINLELTLVLDVSGSMGSASMQNTDDLGNETGFSFSRCDLVCHAARAVCEMLNDYSKLSIISYSNQPITLLPLTIMTDIGKKTAIEKINNIKPGGGTNIADAIFHSFNESDKSVAPATRHIMLLSDGEPTDDKNNILRVMTEKMKTSANTFSTFLFGYDADSILFSKIAKIGNGMYSFIPDCSMIGTVFSNYIANITNIQLSKVKVEVVECVGCTIKNNKNITLHNLHKDQSKNVLYEIKMDELQTNFTITLKIISSKQILCKFESINGELNVESVVVQECRNHFINDLTNAVDLSSVITSFENKQLRISELLTKLRFAKRLYPENSKIDCMIRDFESSNPDEGQITKSFSRHDWFKKWGNHYALSVLRAHELEETSNYKTPSLSYYSGDSFISIRDKADMVFVTIPTPEPSIKPYTRQAYVPMSQDNLTRNFYGGCLDGDCAVDVLCGKKYICDIRRGDIVMHSQGSSTVRCLVRHSTNNETTEYAVLCLNDEPDILPLKITKWHPVKTPTVFSGDPTFPNDVVEFTKKAKTNYFTSENPEFVYNIVMEEGDYPWFTVNGVECVALGHGEKVNTVLAHDYYADKVIDDLKLMPGWDDGYVNVSNKKIRDLKTNLVIGMMI